jgi:hypothetical protein
MITAYGGADTVATALLRGADEFLSKSVDLRRATGLTGSGWSSAPWTYHQRPEP